MIIFAYTLLLTGIFGLSSNNSSSASNSSPVNWIYDPGIAGISVTDVNITRSDSGIMVTGTIKNRYPDVTLLAVALKFHLHGNNSQLLGILHVDPEGILIPDEQQKASFVRVDPEGILKPNQTTNFVLIYDNPETASNLDHIYAKFYSEECGISNVNINGTDMGCFGQRVNLTRIDPETKLPIK